MTRGHSIKLSNYADNAALLPWDIREGNCAESEIRAIDPIPIASNFLCCERQYNLFIKITIKRGAKTEVN